MKKRSPRALKIAQTRQREIRCLALNPELTSSDVKKVALVLGKSPRRIRDWVKEYRATPVLETLMPGQRYSPKRRERLPQKTWLIIRRQLKDFYLGRKEQVTTRDMLARIEQECEAQNTLPPSLSTIGRAMKEISTLERARARKIALKPEDVQSYMHHYDISRPLQVVQIDHTLVDIIIDLYEYGLGRKRVWLTLAIDVASRMVYGYYIGLKAPSARHGGLAILQGVLPKKAWVEDLGISYAEFKQHGIDDPWPIEEVLELVSCDNGKDLKGYAFRQGCYQIGADVFFRPVGQKHYGGHIERLMGTFMRKVHGLPGTTHSNVVKNKGYKSADRCFLTLEDFEQWFVASILEYHLTPHEGLKGQTPLQRYQELTLARPEKVKLMPSNFDVMSAFLPSVKRTVRKQGIRFNNAYYACERLSSLIGKRVTVKYHPGRTNKLLVCLNGISPSFVAHKIGAAGRCQHEDALVDSLPTLAMQEESKRQDRVARKLIVQKQRMIETARKRTKRKNILYLPPRKPPKLPNQTKGGRPHPHRPGNQNKW